MSIYVSLDDSKQPLTLLLKGPPGTGKTTKAAHFPKPVFFNFDNNLSGLKKLPDAIRKEIRVVNPQVKDGKELDSASMWDNFVAQLTIVLEDPHVRTVVIDSLTTLAERLMDKVVGTSNPTVQVTQKHWGDFGKYLKWLADEVLCNPALDKNIIFIAHEQSEKDDASGKVFYNLSIGGKMKSNFDLYFSNSWRCYCLQTMGNPTEYRVRTAATHQFSAKCSLVGIPEDAKWEDISASILKQVH
jgi:hypothetical protein